ncbi:MAG: outer membrane lipoprotein chaperone LolA [Candidatus Solibacter usitatus]|nr:outer membrane lipoprotein chaperone LolA [Candidatus Solibacter usitatus]
MRLSALILLACLSAPARDLAGLLKAVELRYNRAATLEVRFEQHYLAQGRARRVESGGLSLRKPGRMRWQYTTPAGKLFLSDGKAVWFYSPSENRAEHSRLRDIDDFRAPLAFLLGKLDFKRDFGDFELRDSGGESTVIALPRSDKLPYTRVEFTVTADNIIRRLLVTGVDSTVMEFLFTGEKLNPALNDNIFRFTPPPGVEIVEAAR